MSNKPTDNTHEKVFKTVSYLDAPETLTARQLELWNDLVLTMNAGYYKKCDTALIVQYIQIQLLSEKLMEELATEPTATISDAGVTMVNKKINMIDKLAGTSATLAQKLGFAPSTRNRADIKDPSKSNIAPSKMESLLD